MAALLLRGTSTWATSSTTSQPTIIVAPDYVTTRLFLVIPALHKIQQSERQRSPERKRKPEAQEVVQATPCPPRLGRQRPSMTLVKQRLEVQISEASRAGPEESKPHGSEDSCFDRVGGWPADLRPYGGLWPVSPAPNHVSRKVEVGFLRGCVARRRNLVTGHICCMCYCVILCQRSERNA